LDWHTREWLHGDALRRWYAARDSFYSAARKAVGVPGRHADGFERLITIDKDGDE